MAGIIPHYFRGQLEGAVLVGGQPTTASSLSTLTERIGVVLQDAEAQLFNLLVRDELAWGLVLPMRDRYSRYSTGAMTQPQKRWRARPRFELLETMRGKLAQAGHCPGLCRVFTPVR